MCKYVKTQSWTAATLFLIYYWCVFLPLNCASQGTSSGQPTRSMWAQKGSVPRFCSLCCPSASKVILTWYEDSKQEHQLLVRRAAMQWSVTIHQRVNCEWKVTKKKMGQVSPHCECHNHIKDNRALGETFLVNVNDCSLFLSMFDTVSQLFSYQSWWSKLCSQHVLCPARKRQENWLPKFGDILSSRLDSPASKMKQTSDVELHTEIVADILEAIQLHQRRAPTHS